MARSIDNRVMIRICEELSIAHTAQFEQQTTRCRRFAGIDMAHNDQTQMR